MRSLGNSSGLQRALSIVSEFNRPEPTQIIDHAQVLMDLQTVTFSLRNSFAEESDLLDVFLRRSDAHIQQLTATFAGKTGTKLDQVIRTHAWLNASIKKVVVHAIRTATDISYRDVMLIRDSLGMNSAFGVGNCKKLGIRVVRMHWYAQHWMQIKAMFKGLTGKELWREMEKRKNKEMEFGELMVVLTRDPIWQ
jgi:hypothetical protein